MNPYIFLGIQAVATGVLTAWAIQLYRWQKTLRVWHSALSRLQRLLTTQQAYQIFGQASGPTTDPMYPDRDHHTMH